MKGFSPVEGLVVIGVLVLVGGLGLVGWKTFTKDTTSPAAVPVSNSATAEVITTREDLESAERQLDALNIEDESSATAEAQANF